MEDILSSQHLQLFLNPTPVTTSAGYLEQCGVKMIKLKLVCSDK